MPDQLHQRLGGAGLRVGIGPFIFHLRTPIRGFVADFSLAYADFPICDESEVSDFRVCVSSALGRRPWHGVRAQFRSDGVSPLGTFPRRFSMPYAEWGFNWCIYSYAHQFLVFHAAVVEKAGRAAILAGPAGSGKSTLCVAMLARGWRLLSDEFALLDPARCRLLPIPRPVALKGISIGLAQKLLPCSRIGRVFTPTRKGTLAHLRPPADAVERQAEPARPAWVVFPTHAEGADTRLVRVRKTAGFLRLEQSCFNYNKLDRTGFDALSQLIETTECYKLPFAHAVAASELVDGLAERQPVTELPLYAT
jgi:HprK-related kinase A